VARAHAPRHTGSGERASSSLSSSHSAEHTYDAFGLIGTALSRKISVFHPSSLKVVPISPNASRRAWPHRRLRRSGAESLSESGLKWMNGSARRECDRARSAPPPPPAAASRRPRLAQDDTVIPHVLAGRTLAVVGCHRLPVHRDLHSNLAVIAVGFLSKWRCRPGLARKVPEGVAEPVAAVAERRPVA
jgi:hypothetical protein